MERINMERINEIKKDLKDEVIDVLIITYFDVPVDIDNDTINLIDKLTTKILSDSKKVEKLTQLKKTNELEYYIVLHDLANTIAKRIILYNIVKILSKL